MNEERLCHSFDRHSASRHDDTIKHRQPLLVSLMIFVLFVIESGLSFTSVGQNAIRSPEHTIPGLLSTLKYIFADLKNVIKNMSCGHSRDDVLHAAHRVG